MTTELNQEIKPLTLSAQELAEARELDKAGIGHLWVAPDPFMEYGWAALLNRAPDAMETTTEVEEAFVAGGICSEHTASEDPDLAEKALGETFAKAEAIAAAWNLRPRLIATIDQMTAMSFDNRHELRELKAERDIYAEQLAVTLAILGLHRAAMTEAGKIALKHEFPEDQRLINIIALLSGVAEKLTPEALRQQQERMAALERIAAAAREVVNVKRYRDDAPAWICDIKHKDEMADALAALDAVDAVKGGQA